MFSDITGCLIQTVQHQSVLIFFQTIFLQDNVIGQIRRHDLVTLRHLHYLYLQVTNTHTHISMKVRGEWRSTLVATTKYCIHLLLPHLQNNTISAVEPGSFQNQGQLLELALNGNRIHLVTADMFKGLEHLRILYLARNDITRLLDHTFRGLQVRGPNRGR